MAIPTASPQLDIASASPSTETTFGLWPLLERLLKPLASLRLTVVLFALGVFLVLAGTVAQIDYDIWFVVHGYFRTWLAWIPLRVFFPRSLGIPPEIAFPYPGGWVLLTLLSVNLFAAHATRFKVQATGMRLFAGLVVIALGMVVTGIVVASGSNKAGFSGEPVIPYGTLWAFFKGALAVLGLGLWGAAIFIDAARKAERISLGIVGSTALATAIYLILNAETAVLGDSSMRILWQLTKATAAGLVLLAGCMMVFRKRGGIVLLHLGVALLMFNELYVAVTNHESMMRLHTGQSANYLEDQRTVELAFVDPSNPREDDVVVVPKQLLTDSDKPVIKHDALPVDIEVVKFFPNARLREAKPTDDNPATHGVGQHLIPVEMPPVTGINPAGNTDYPAAYIKLIDKQTRESLGTYLVAVELSEQAWIKKTRVPPTIIHEKPYEVALRYERHYRPYAVQLLEARFDRYPGTNTPKNYSSDVRLVSPSREIDREVKIWMNNPLRFAGETFYQSGIDSENATPTYTLLMVVKNEGWMLPYVACMLTMCGLLAHFSLTLGRFLNRDFQQQRLPQAASGDSRSFLARHGFAMFIVSLMLMMMAYSARTPRAAPGQFDVYAFGQLPLLYEGRLKPFDTLARNSLQVLSGRETWKDASDKSQPAALWLLDLISRPATAADHCVVRIDSLELLSSLKLENRKGLTYSLSEIEAGMPLIQIDARVQALRGKPSEELDLYERKLVELHRRLMLYYKLFTTFEVQHIPEQLAEATDPQTILSLLGKLENESVRTQAPLVIPPIADQPYRQWDSYSYGWTKAYLQVQFLDQEPHPAAKYLNTIFTSYANNNPGDFNEGVAKYIEWLQANMPSHYDPAKVRVESFVNKFSPFSLAAVMYGLAFILTALGWLAWRKPLHSAAFWLLVTALLLHTVAIAARVYISGRPPVTNLYSSALFVGWGSVALGLVIERLTRVGIGSAVAAVCGFSALLIAQMLTGDGDTLIVMQAVLDTQFWLWTHVICISAGYVATFVAGFLGIAYTVMALLQRLGLNDFTKEEGKQLARMIYGVVCFGLLLSFFGTVLGGLWADDSWGRFWGWDPKENGALMIVIWNALVLHARWGGMVRERGLAVLAMAGNIATVWSWFGVNNLGKGLHSYGFTEGLAWVLLGVVLTQLGIIVLGALLPPVGEPSRHVRPMREAT